MRLNRRSAMLGTAALAAGSLLTPIRRARAVTPGKPYAGTELKVMVVRAAQFAAEAKRLPQFEEATGIKASFIDIPFVAMREKLTAEMVAGSADFDVVMPMDYWVPSLVGDYLAPLSDGIETQKIDLNDYPKPFLHTALYEDEVYGLPIRCHIQLLFYRKDLFDELNLQPPRTWSELVDTGKQIQAKKSIAAVSIPYGKNNGQNLMVWYNFLWGAGGELFDQDMKPAFNSEAGLKGTQDYVDLLLKYKLTPPGAASFMEQDAVTAFIQNNAAMLPTWWHSWNRFGAKDSAIRPEQVAFALLPSYAGKPQTTYTNNWIYGINKNSDKFDAAMEFLAWVTRPELEREILLDPDLNEVVAVHWSTLRDPKVNERYHGMQKLAAQALENTDHYIPNIPEYLSVIDVLEVAMSTIATGGASVPDAMNSAAAQVSRVMRRAR